MILVLIFYVYISVSLVTTVSTEDQKSLKQARQIQKNYYFCQGLKTPQPKYEVLPMSKKRALIAVCTIWISLRNILVSLVLIYYHLINYSYDKYSSYTCICRFIHQMDSFYYWVMWQNSRRWLKKLKNLSQPSNMFGIQTFLCHGIIARIWSGLQENISLYSIASYKLACSLEVKQSSHSWIPAWRVQNVIVVREMQTEQYS